MPIEKQVQNQIRGRQGMKKKQVWRYYCDFCKKSGCNGGHMKRHENSCTNNPDRKCKMCDSAGFEQKPIAVLISALGKGDGDGVKKLRELSEGCPVCMLAAIRQSKLQYYHCDEDGDSGYRVEFEFKDEKNYFWRTINGS